MTGGCCHHPASSDFIFSVHSTRLLPGMLCTGLGDEKGIDQHQRRALVVAREACGVAPASGGLCVGQVGRGQADATGPREAI